MGTRNLYYGDDVDKYDEILSATESISTHDKFTFLYYDELLWFRWEGTTRYDDLSAGRADPSHSGRGKTRADKWQLNIGPADPD